MSQLQCRELIESRLQQWAEANDIRVAYERQKFEKPSLDKPERYLHIQTFLLPASTVTEDLEGTHSLFSGVFAMNIVSPKLKGAGPAGRVAKQLFDLFKANLELTADDGFKVTITSPVTESRIIEGDVDDTTPTSFQYEARTVT